MQDNGNTDYEQNLTDVRSGAAEPRTSGNISGGIGILWGYTNPEGFPRRGFLKGISVYHKDTNLIVLQ